MEDKVICNKSDLVNTADAIRSKLGVTDTYYVSELSSAIQSIETGGIVPSGTISITENGTVDVIQYASAEVNVSSPLNLQSKSVTITSNGTVSVTPDAPYDALKKVDVTVNVASGGGGGAGFKVTFPATATNWDRVSAADLLLSDGTVKSFKSYSEVSGKTIENVVGIHCIAQSAPYVLQMTLSEGSLAQCTMASPQSVTYRITTPNNTTMSWYNGGQTTFWWPLADTVISAIEMYNTD